MTTREVFQQTIRRDLAGLEQKHPNLKWLLENIILPILSLFPGFFIGIHYLGKTFSRIKRMMEKL
ncbi:MAG: hypothetical protein EHM81_10155 [Chloroflexi bacterium]|nr:MAG: hypothetical protein EHM81_10155 [Chloroflexota bacterium]